MPLCVYIHVCTNLQNEHVGHMGLWAEEEEGHYFQVAWHIDGNGKQWLIHRGTWMQPRYNQMLKHYSLKRLPSIIVEKTHKPSISYIALKKKKTLLDLLQCIFFPLIIIWLFCQIMAKNAGNFFFFLLHLALGKSVGFREIFSAKFLYVHAK